MNKLWAVVGIIVAFSVVLFHAVSAPKQESRPKPGWSTPQDFVPGIDYSLASSNGVLHLVHESGDLYYRRSTNEGGRWSSDVLLASGVELHLDRPIAADGSNIYVIYLRNIQSFTDNCCFRTTGQIFLRKSADGGLSWGPEKQLTSSLYAYRVALVVSGSNVYLTWSDYRNGKVWDTYFMASHDGGASWGAEIDLIPGVVGTINGIALWGASRPDVAVTGAGVHVFTNSDQDGYVGCYGGVYPCSEIYYAASSDLGVSWSLPRNLTGWNTLEKGRPIATVSSTGRILVTWEEEQASDDTNNTTIMYSDDMGVTWSPKQDLPEAYNQSHPWIHADGTVVHNAWHSYDANGVAQIQYRKSADNGQSWGSVQQLTNNPTDSLVPVLATTTNYVHMVFTYNGDVWYARAPK